MTIYPTHTCFDDAIEFFEEKIKDEIDEVKNNKYILCHGIINPEENNLDKKAIAHAWIEEDNYVWFSGILDNEKVWIQADKEEYYKESNVLDVTRYSVEDIWRYNSRHKTYGPWLDKYLVLCNNKTKL